MSTTSRATSKTVKKTTATRRPGTPKRRTQAERSEIMQLRLVEAAAKVLKNKGYAGLRTDEVVRVAKASRGALLHHFPAKDDLVIATAAHLFRKGLERGAARADAARNNTDVIEAIIQDGMEFFLGLDFPVVLDLVIASGKNNSLRDDIYRFARESRMGVEEAWIQVLHEQGVPAAKAEKIVWITLSIVRGFAVRALWQKDELLFRSVLDEWKLILAGHLKSLPR